MNNCSNLTKRESRIQKKRWYRLKEPSKIVRKPKFKTIDGRPEFKKITPCVIKKIEPHNEIYFPNNLTFFFFSKENISLLVSFQQDSFDDDSTKNESIKEEKNILLIRSNQSSSINRGNSRSPTPEETITTTTTTTWKTEISKLVPSLPSLIQENEINIPLTDREKRCLVVPISDLRDKKRKLLRTKSTPPKPGYENIANIFFLEK